MNIRSAVRRFVAVVALFVALVALSACVPARGRLYVRVGPPAPVVEARIAEPGPGYVWVPGYYFWSGGRYVWRPGVWMRPPRGRRAWEAGHWMNEGRRGWFWMDGHWR